MSEQGRSTEVVRIDALVCGPEFLSLMDEPRVIAIAERLAINGGSSTLPIVRSADMNVIAGEDIIAAHCLLDLDELQVELVHDGSLDDEPGTELSPDVETRYAGGAVSAAAERTDVTPAPVWNPDAEGQRATLERVEAVLAQLGTQKAAVAAVAAETGRSEHAVKKAANRAKRAKDKVSIETWGRPQPEAWMADTAELRRALTNASNSIRTAMSALSPLMGISVPGANPAVAYEELKERASKLRDARPACVCAWCKNEPMLVARCVACCGRGWLGEKAMGLVPKELFPPGSAMAQGRPVELAPPVPAVHGFPYDSLGQSDGEAREAERVASEHVEAAWDALEGANGGEAFLDDEDGGVW